MVEATMRSVTITLFLAVFLMSLAVPAAADTYVAGQVSGVWTAAGSPYYALADIEVPFGSSLIIEPGVEVKFTGHFKFIAHGTLTAIGMPGDSIRITHSLPYPTNTWAGLSFLQTQGTPELAYCIIEWGYAQGILSEPFSKGGGIHVYNCSPIIRNCRISNCKADFKGGGIYLYQTYAEIGYCEITNNQSYDDGGGIYVQECANTYIHDNIIFNNTADHGAGMHYESSGGLLESNYINYNIATSYSGAGISCDYSSPNIQYNVINWNTSVNYNGTGIYLHHYSSPLILYNEVCQNNLGAVFCGDHCSPELINNTINQNGHNAIRAYQYSHPSGRNNIITGNTYQFYIYSGCSITMTYSDIQGGYYGIGNIWEWALFIDPNAGNYFLQPNSPCIDAGDPADQVDPDGTRRDMGAHFFDQSSPQGYCVIDLTPFGTPIVLPPSGGTVWFGVTIMNPTSNFNIYDGWYNLQQPDMQIIPMVLRQGLYLGPGGSLNRTLYLTLGSMAMPGTYTVTAYVGEHPAIIESFDSFTFEKLADGDLSGSGGEVTFFDGEVEETFALKGALMPDATALLGHFPEPFNPQATIAFSLAADEKVRLEVYSISGQKVMTLLDRTMSPGFYSESFDGSGLASGVYLYVLDAGEYQATGKMVLMK
jgi:parallel beta-helix repeat protein